MVMNTPELVHRGVKFTVKVGDDWVEFTSEGGGLVSRASFQIPKEGVFAIHEWELFYQRMAGLAWKQAQKMVDKAVDDGLPGLLR